MVLVLFILTISPVGFAALTTYWSFDATVEPDIANEPGFSLQISGSVGGSHSISAFGGQTGFLGALLSIPDAWSCYWGDDYTQTYNSTQGTIEFWVSPNWNGTNQGGPGIGGTGATQDLTCVGGYPWMDGLQIFIFNNGVPDDGGQLFAYWKDSLGNVVIFEAANGGGVGYPFGSTKDWIAGQWHHIAFCWDASNLRLFLDGNVVDSQSRPASADPFATSIWVAGNAGALPYTLNGKIDDLGIWDEVRYTSAYTVPTEPIIQLPVFSFLTAYWSFDFSVEPDFAREPGLALQWQGGSSGWHSIDPDGGQTDFRGALTSVPDAWTCYWGDDYTQTFKNPQGTIEFWVSPSFNGINQGGSGIGGTGSTEELICVSGYPWMKGLQIFLFNNGVPDDGGQLFAYWQDSLSNSATLSAGNGGGVGYPHGSTQDWVSGEWHHIAFCWDASNLRLFLDGQVVDAQPRPSSADGFDLGIWVAGHTNGTVGINTLNGKLDELCIWNTVIYTGAYSLPTEPVIPIDSNLLLAFTPAPSDGETGLDIRTDLSWLAGVGAVSHDVYLGTSYEDVNNADDSGPSGSGYVYRGNQDPCSYTIPDIPLALNTTYFWRVDEVGNDAPKGKIWSFTTSEQDVPAGFLVLGNTVPPEYDPPTIPGGYAEQAPSTNTTPPTWTPEETTRGYVAYVKSYLDLIYPVTAPLRAEITNQLSSFSAPGEYEPAAFTIYAISSMTDVSVSISNLTGPGGSIIDADNIDIRSVRCWPRKVWAQQKYIVTPSFLEKRAMLDIPGSSSQRYWLTVYVPADAPAGIYNATVTIDVGSHTNYALNLEFEVLDIQLMTGPTQHGMYYNPTYQIPSIWLDPLPAERLRKDVKNMQEHGMTTLYVPYPAVCESYTAQNGEILYNLGPMHPFGEACRKASFGPIVYNVILSEIIDSPLGTWTEMLAGYANSFEYRGWPSLMPSVGDEADADPERTALVQARLAAVKSEIPTMQTYQNIVWPENSELFEPDADIRAFSSYMDQTVVAPTRAAGRGLWGYSGAATYGIDPKADRFYHGIWAARLTLDGVLDWTYYHPVLDPAQPYQDLFAGVDRNNMTAWVWPTDDGPLPSTGWEGMREGIEDNRYIYTLTTLIDKARETGYSYPSSVADAAEIYLNSLYSQIDTSPRANDSIFPVKRESNKLTSSFYGFRNQLANHIYELNISLGDINGDFSVDYKDVARMAENWLTLYDFEDFALLAANFGKNNNPGNP